MTEASLRKVLFTFAEVANMTGLRESWLRKAVSEQGISHRRVGKHVRFSQDDIDALVAQAAVPPAAALPRRARRTA